MFDEYISIGDNCEAGLNFRRIGNEHSSLFRFARCNLEQVIDLLENEALGLFDTVKPVSKDMIMCERYGISWHTNIKSKKTDEKWTFIDDMEIINKQLPLEREKLIYLYEKLIFDIKNKDIAIFFKSNFGFSIEKIIDLEKIISSISKNNNHLIIIGTTCETKIFGHGFPRNTVIEKFSYFPPYSDAHGYSQECWDRVFRKYPLNKIKK